MASVIEYAQTAPGGGAASKAFNLGWLAALAAGAYYLFRNGGGDPLDPGSFEGLGSQPIPSSKKAQWDMIRRIERQIEQALDLEERYGGDSPAFKHAMHDARKVALKLKARRTKLHYGPREALWRVLHTFRREW